MSDDKKTLKFQMMMSPDEARALDDWMFNNRLRSRAEAIRRLCQIALLLDKEIPNLNKSIDAIPKILSEYGNMVSDLSKDGTKNKELIDAISRKSALVSKEINHHIKLLLKIALSVESFKGGDDLETLSERAEIVSGILDDLLKKFENTSATNSGS